MAINSQELFGGFSARSNYCRRNFTEPLKEETGERLAVHSLNDEVDAAEPRPGDKVTLRWSAEHSYVIGSSDNPKTTTVSAGTEPAEA